MTLFEAVSKNKANTTLSTDYAKQHNIGHEIILNYIKLLIMHNDINSKYFICQKFGPIDDLKTRFIIHPKGIEHLNEYYKINEKKLFNLNDILNDIF